MSVHSLTICGRSGTNVEHAETVTPDWVPESNVDKLGAYAQSVVMDVRQCEPQLVMDVLAMACAIEPARMAQLLMVLAAWVNDEEPLSVRGARVEAITEGPRSARRAGL